MSRTLLLLALFGTAAALADQCSEGAPCNAKGELEDVNSLLQQNLHLHQSIAEVQETQLATGAKVSQTVAKVSQTAKRQEPEEPHNETEPAPSAAVEASGVTLNAEGDLDIFFTGLMTYGFGSCFLVAVFMFAKGRYPRVYSENVLKGFAPKTPPDAMFGWASAAWNTTTEESAASIGLDNALLLEFCVLCMRVLGIISIPMVLIMGPMNLIFGGNAAGADHLSYFSFGNVRSGPGSWSWLYWVHSFVIWFVVFIVQVNIYSSMSRFLKMRYKWLRELPEPRSTTVLVEFIPEAYRSDAKLKEFFTKMFEAKDIKEAYVVKYTPELEGAIARKEAAEYGLAKATANKDTASIEFYEKEGEAASEQIVEERAKVKEAAKEVGSVNCSAGFVTFNNRSSAEIAKNLQFSGDTDEWQVSTPPDSKSILWHDLQMDTTKAGGKTLIGYALVAGLYIVYLPAVIWITTVATSIDMGPFQSLWASVAPTMGLQFMVAFLPTFLIWIFRLFFILKDEAWEQQRLQNWYFVFNVVFVIMVTAIGSNVMGFTRTLATFFCSPLDTFTLLGDAMPQATHFYMNFMVMQWMTHSLNLTRMVPMAKFWSALSIYDEDEAKELAEPEDQDYYGLGSRSARFATNMLIGIIYGTLCPWMYPLTFVNFLLCRIYYGYLIPFAETKKADLGGAFFVAQLKHLFIGNMIYVMMMTGVLYGRAASSGPAFISGFSLFYVIWSYYRFNNQFVWEKLPYEEIKGGEFKTGPPDGVYVQPCMLDTK